MLEELIAIAIAIFILISLSWLTAKIFGKYFDWYYTKQNKERRAKYPELFEMNETLEEFNKQRWDYLDIHVEGTKRKIDKLLAEMPYLTDRDKVMAEQELEELRDKYCIAKGEYADIQDTWLDMRKKIDKYLEEHPEIDWWNQG